MFSRETHPLQGYPKEDHVWFHLGVSVFEGTPFFGFKGELIISPACIFCVKGNPQGEPHILVQTKTTDIPSHPHTFL